MPDRLSPRLRRILGPVVLVLLALIPVWRAVLLGEAIGPVDHIRAMLDPVAPRPETPWNVLQADSLLQFRVWRGLVFDGWRQGMIPTWNPYSLLGTPLLANSQSGALYPFHILAGVLRLPLDHAIGLLAWLHLSLAGIGTYRLCRALGTDRASAFFGGSAFLLSAFLLAWTPLASVPTTVAWIPWALYWVARRDLRWRSVAWLSISLAMMILAGHLQFAVYGILGVLVFALAQGAWRALPAFALAGALAGAHLLPTLDFGQYSHRRTPPTAEGYAAYSKSALQLWQLAAVPAPDALGLPQRADIGDGRGISTYWPARVKLGESFAEAAVGLGPVVFVLIVVAPWRTRGVRAIAATGGAGLLLAMPTALAQALYFGLPGWAATGSPGRASVLFVLGGCVLGAMGLSRLLAHPLSNLSPGGRENPFPPSITISWQFSPVLMIVLAYVWVESLITSAPPYVVGLEPGQYSGGRIEPAFDALLSCLGVSSLLLVLLFVPQFRKIRLVAAGLPVLYAGLTHGPDLIPTGPMPELPTAPSLTRVAVVNERWSLFNTPKAIVPPNLLAAARIVDTGGYDSLLDRETKEILDRVNGTDSPPPENGNMMFIRPSANPDELRALGVSELWSREPIGGLEVIGETNGAVRQRIGGSLVQVTGVQSRPYDLKLKPNGIEASGGSADRALLLWRHLPGWRAEGAALQGGRFLELSVSGANAFRLTYDPPGLRTGLILSGIGLFVLIGLFVVSRRGPSCSAAERPTMDEETA